MNSRSRKSITARILALYCRSRCTACHTELSAQGSASFRTRGVENFSGHEVATVRVDPHGKVTLLVGVSSHGQSHETTLAQMKRSPDELVGFLFRENVHPQGCLFMTGTGIVPPDDFSLQAGDVIEIEIDGVGKLVNPVQ